MHIQPYVPYRLSTAHNKILLSYSHKSAKKSSQEIVTLRSLNCCIIPLYHTTSADPNKRSTPNTEVGEETCMVIILECLSLYMRTVHDMTSHAPEKARMSWHKTYT